MLKDMKTHSHLKPGQKGTRRLVAYKVDLQGKSMRRKSTQLDQKTKSVIIE